MPMRRREKHVTGEVRFPIDDPKYTFNPEGGTFVRVMVTEPNPRDSNDQYWKTCWMECCGGQSRVNLEETLKNEDLEKRLWPRLYDANGDFRETPDANDYQSVPCLAVMTLGSTGWVGWDEANDRYWTCTENDLTDQGRAILEQLRALYPGREIHLTTWLDT